MRHISNISSFCVAVFTKGFLNLPSSFVCRNMSSFTKHKSSHYLPEVLQQVKGNICMFILTSRKGELSHAKPVCGSQGHCVSPTSCCPEPVQAPCSAHPREPCCPRPQSAQLRSDVAQLNQACKTRAGTTSASHHLTPTLQCAFNIFLSQLRKHLCFFKRWQTRGKGTS